MCCVGHGISPGALCAVGPGRGHGVRAGAAGRLLPPLSGQPAGAGLGARDAASAPLAAEAGLFLRPSVAIDSCRWRRRTRPAPFPPCARPHCTAGQGASADMGPGFASLARPRKPQGLGIKMQRLGCHAPVRRGSTSSPPASAPLRRDRSAWPPRHVARVRRLPVLRGPCCGYAFAHRHALGCGRAAWQREWLFPSIALSTFLPSSTMPLNCRCTCACWW